MKSVMVYDGRLLEHFMDYDWPVVIDLQGLDIPDMMSLVAPGNPESSIGPRMTHVRHIIKNGIMDELWLEDYGNVLDERFRYELVLEKIDDRFVEDGAVHVNGRVFNAGAHGIYVIDHARLWDVRVNGLALDRGMQEKPADDSVNHPSHYTSHPSGVECIDIAKHYDFCVGNAIKYLWRSGLKHENGMDDRAKQIEDLKKAIWYIDKKIEMLKEVSEK